VLSSSELSAPRALALAELIRRLRPDDAEADALADELRAGLVRALKAAPDASPPDPPPKTPRRIREYRRRKAD
jgi:hypothetical protein